MIQKNYHIFKHSNRQLDMDSERRAISRSHGSMQKIYADGNDHTAACKRSMLLAIYGIHA